MKLAVTGTAGLGKSTLSRRLAEKYQLELIEEGFNILNAAKDRKDLIQLLQQILNRKATLEANAERFVTDRCPIDLIHNWIGRRLHKIDPHLSANFINNCIQECRKYDFIVILPWNSFKFQQATEGLFRNTDNFELLRNQSNLIGYTHLWIRKEKIIQVSQTANKLEDRINVIETVIQQRRPDLL